jgi:hypothetical protein
MIRRDEMEITKVKGEWLSDGTTFELRLESEPDYEDDTKTRWVWLEDGVDAEMSIVGTRQDAIDHLIRHYANSNVELHFDDETV